MTATTHQGDYSNDWQWWDNTESVTATLTRANGAVTTKAISDAFRGDVEGRLQNYPELVVSERSVVWSVPYTLLGSSNTLEEADELAATDATWIVDSAVLVTVGNSKCYWLAVTHKKHS